MKQSKWSFYLLGTYWEYKICTIFLCLIYWNYILVRRNIAMVDILQFVQVLMTCFRASLHDCGNSL